MFCSSCASAHKNDQKCQLAAYICRYGFLLSGVTTVKGPSINASASPPNRAHQRSTSGRRRAVSSSVGAVLSRAGEITGGGLSVRMQSQHKDRAACLIFPQKAPRPAANDDHRLLVLIGLHVDACPIARVALDIDLAAPHGIARRVAHAAADHDGTAVHRIAYGVLCVAVDGKETAPQIRAQGVAGDAVDLHPASAHARADKPLPKAAGDAA